MKKDRNKGNERRDREEERRKEEREAGLGIYDFWQERRRQARCNNHTAGTATARTETKQQEQLAPKKSSLFINKHSSFVIHNSVVSSATSRIKVIEEATLSRAIALAWNSPIMLENVSFQPP